MWTIIPDATVRATEATRWLARLRYLWRRRKWAPQAVVAITDINAGTIRTHPDNVATLCAYLSTTGESFKVGAPVLRTVVGGRK